jgi:hypothetical protein
VAVHPAACPGLVNYWLSLRSPLVWTSDAYNSCTYGLSLLGSNPKHQSCPHTADLRCCLAPGNDFSTLYAPLIRDGRMEKYYWNPTREDRVGICIGIFQDDDVNRGDVELLVDTFPGQSIDFFGALRARIYDDKVRAVLTISILKTFWAAYYSFNVGGLATGTLGASFDSCRR